MGELYGIMMGYLMGKSWNITMGNPVKMFPKQSIETWITGNLGRASLAFFCEYMDILLPYGSKYLLRNYLGYDLD